MNTNMIKGDELKRFSAEDSFDLDFLSEQLDHYERVKEIFLALVEKKILPSNPAFFFALLQNIKGDKNSLGNLYAFFITQALSQVDKTSEEMNASTHYLAELAYYFFDKDIDEVSRDRFIEFHDAYCWQFDQAFDFEAMANKFVSLSIIKIENGFYSFSYQYLFYFFVRMHVVQCNAF